MGTGCEGAYHEVRKINLFDDPNSEEHGGEDAAVFSGSEGVADEGAGAITSTISLGL